jgi:hypothetical protein
MTARNRVYWHGVFPDFTKQGTVNRRGTIRHEVVWDSSPDRVSLESIDALKPVGQHAKCDCGRCGKVKV